MPLAAQAKLLRALQERSIYRVGGTRPIKVDARVLAASNADLNQAISAGRFRRDLFYRLDDFHICIPPLRQRPEDVMHLAKRFLRESCQELGKAEASFTAEAEHNLTGFEWPGNVRELRSVVRRGALLANGAVDAEHVRLRKEPRTQTFPRECDLAVLQEEKSMQDIVRDHTAKLERLVLEQTLRRCHGNKAEVARLLRMDYKTIHTKLKKYGISVENLNGDD